MYYNELDELDKCDEYWDQLRDDFRPSLAAAADIFIGR